MATLKSRPMAEYSVPVQTFVVAWECEHCFAGSMVYQGGEPVPSTFVLKTGECEWSYFHQCDECGAQAYLSECYPKVEYDTIDE